MTGDFAFRRSQVDTTAWIADNATVLGDVTISAWCTIWYGAILRAEAGFITIGARSNIQDSSIIHSEAEEPVVLGEEVTLGHGAIVHAARVGDRSLIAIRATVLTGAQIGEECLIGAGALVPPGKTIPPRSLVLGVPGQVVRSITDADLAEMHATAAHHVELARQFMEKRRLDNAGHSRV
jgi:carbonic anhydrase/acetyltransferase-like protein (isoleucine patch superfamily)